MSDGIRIVDARIKNFRKVKMVHISPSRNLVVISGRNEQGKTSVLDAIATALSGTKAPFKRVVNKDAEKATISIKTDTGLTIEQYYTTGGTYGLRVKGADGQEYKAGASFLERFSNKFQWDPLEFMRQDARKQVESLRALVGLDFNEIERERREAYEERTLVNRNIKTVEAKNRDLGAFDGVPDVELSVSDLSDELRQGMEHNQKLDTLKADRALISQQLDGVHDSKSANNRRIDDLKAQIARIEAENVSLDESLKSLNDKAQSGTKAIEEFVSVDLEGVRADLANAEETNQRVRLKKQVAAARDEWQALTSQATALTAKIEKCDARKADMIAKADMPVEGLSLSEDGVLFKGIPLDECSKSEQVRVCFNIGIAYKPEMKVLIIRDGSLFDEDNIKLLEDLATEKDVQILLEIVGDGGPEAIEIEDGLVVGAETEAELPEMSATKSESKAVPF